MKFEMMYIILLSIVMLAIILIVIYRRRIFKNWNWNNNINEGFNSTDYSEPPVEINERHLDPSILLNKKINVRSDFKVVPNDPQSGIYFSEPDFLHMPSYSTHKSDIDPKLYEYANKYKPDWMSDNSNINKVYGKVFYYDKRFLESATDIDFAIDPKTYCSINPTVYPCLNKN